MIKIGMYEFKYCVCFFQAPIALFHELEEAENFMQSNLIANRIVELIDEDEEE